MKKLILLVAHFLFCLPSISNAAGISYSDISKKTLALCAQLPEADYGTILSCDLTKPKGLGLEIAGHNPTDTMTDRIFEFVITIKYLNAGQCLQKGLPIKFGSRDGANYTARVGTDPGFSLPSPCQ